MRAVRQPFARRLALAVLVAWSAPGAMVLGIALHLSFDHHPSTHLEHSTAIAELAQAAAHGHHHEIDTDHDHQARLASAAPLAQPDAASTAVLSTASMAVDPGDAPRIDRRARRGPPTPLFTAHCSLLL